MSKRAEDLAKQLYPDPRLEDYDDILVYRADRDNSLTGRSNVICVYEQAEKDLGWHSVEESLPPVDEEVIVLADEIGVAPMYKICFGHIVKQTTYKLKIDSEIKEFTLQNHNGWNITGVRYWMPMPEIPNEYE